MRIRVHTYIYTSEYIIYRCGILYTVDTCLFHPYKQIEYIDIVYAQYGYIHIACYLLLTMYICVHIYTYNKKKYMYIYIYYYRVRMVGCFGDGSKPILHMDLSCFCHRTYPWGNIQWWDNPTKLLGFPYGTMEVRGKDSIRVKNCMNWAFLLFLQIW